MTGRLQLLGRGRLEAESGAGRRPYQFRQQLSPLVDEAYVGQPPLARRVRH